MADAVTAALMPTRDMLLTGQSAPAWEPQRTVRAHWFDTAQATRALAERRGVSREDALALMRAEAFRTGRTLADITRDVLHDPKDTA